MNRPDCIIFDLDGTLVDTARDLSASLNHALAMLGRPPVDPLSVRAMVGHGARKLLERGLAATGAVSPELIESGVPHFMDYYGRHIADHSLPFAGVETALDRLTEAGLPVAICTNKPERLARQLIAALGWTARFGALTGADSFAFRKPDPRHLMETAALLGCHHPLFVGDSKTDADTALAAGAPLILVTFGYSTEPVEDLGADHLIDHYDQLWPLVDAMTGPVQSRFSAAPASPPA